MKRRFNSQAGRDMSWVLRSPMLLEHPCAVEPRWGMRESDRYRGVLSMLDDSGSTLASAVRGLSSGRLGEYFELLMSCWVDAVPPAELLASNWQAFGGKGTVGEYDLLFRRDARVHHWELAIKFYLGHPGPFGKSCWFGPNPADRLDRKWAKMRGQQLRLSNHPAGRGALRMLGIKEEVHSRAFIKGYLFLPLDDDFAVDMPIDVNPDGLRGWWSHRGRLGHHRDRLDPDGSVRWISLSRLRWMSPVYVEPGDRLYRFDDLAESLSPKNYHLVAGVQETDQGFREVTRGFIVQDGWPTA